MGSAKNVIVACGLKQIDVDLLIHLVTTLPNPCQVFQQKVLIELKIHLCFTGKNSEDHCEDINQS